MFFSVIFFFFFKQKTSYDMRISVCSSDVCSSDLFHPEELLLRIQALLRRAHGLANQPMLQAGGLELDESRQCCRKDGQDIELTAGEFRLLRYFMLHPRSEERRVGKEGDSACRFRWHA